MIETSALIKTKVLAPFSRPGMVRRTSLLDTLNSAKSKKLVSITAPAGFGKTTLLGQWYSSLQDAGDTTCWLSLDASDNDPESFIHYLIAAFQQSIEKFGLQALRYMDNAPLPDISKSLVFLANELVEFEKDVFLFVDDYHLITSSEVNQFVELLLNVSPENLHIVLSGRSTPMLPLASFRARNDFLQILSDNLRFDFDESKSFMLDCQKVEISSEQVKTLFSRCDGWAAGLQLASVSLRDAENHDEFIQQFSGSDRDITDYLAATVLARQPEHVQSFLIGTAILDRFSRELCNELLDRRDADEILRGLEANNLFIVPLDHERQWYRYHPLFQEFLIAQLSLEQKDSLSRCNRIASEWFRREGHLHEAVTYALRANDMSLAADLIEIRALEEFLDGRMPRVASWIKRIPVDVQQQRPKLMLLLGTALYHMNQADKAVYVCDRLEECVARLVDQGDMSFREHQDLAGDMAILRAGVSMSLDNASDAIEDAPQEDYSHPEFVDGVINNIKGYCFYVLGEFDSARKHLALARRVHRLAASDFGVMYSDCFLCLLELAQGNLKRAQQIVDNFQHAPDDLEQNLSVASAADVVRGAVAYELNEHHSIVELLQPRLVALEQVGHISLIQLGYVTLAKYFAAKGDYDGALRLLERLNVLYPLPDSNLNHKLFVGYHRIKILLHGGRRSEALKTASMLDIGLDDALPVFTSKWSREGFQQQLIQMRLWLAAGQQEPLISVGTRLYQQAQEIGMGFRAIECLLVLSQAHYKSDNRDNAANAMQLALSHASMNDVIRLFVDEGAALVPIIKLVQRNLAATDDIVLSQFVTNVLGAFEGELRESAEHNHSMSAAGLIETLSQREMDVLHLMGQGHTNGSIAEALGISENTVKWHGRNVFGKLRVSNRTAAVITAQELGLIDSL